MGRAGELVAALFLAHHGLVPVGANLEVAGGEIDLVAMDGARRVAVEVRTTTHSEDPIDAVDESKRRKVEQLARSAGADRVDFMGIRFGDEGIDVHWLPGRAS